VSRFPPVHVLGEQAPLDPRLAIDFGDLIDRCLHARRHVADAPQGFGHGVGGFPEGNQLAAGIRQFGELEGRFRAQLAEFGQRLFGHRRVAYQR
jgi:hypothetical protein